MNWRRLFIGRENRRSHAIRIVATAVLLLGAIPAWPQNEGAGAPNPGNALTSAPFSEFMARYSRPQIAEAAPRASRKQASRVRASRFKQRAVAPELADAALEPQPPEPPQPESQPSTWPIAHESVGVAGLVPVEIKTVREIVEADASLVQENELSDLDLSARPISRLDEAFSSTDGRAEAEETEGHANRIAAFAENLKAIGSAGWLEPLMLALVGAIAAVTALRVFAA